MEVFALLCSVIYLIVVALAVILPLRDRINIDLNIKLKFRKK